MGNSDIQTLSKPQPPPQPQRKWLKRILRLFLGIFLAAFACAGIAAFAGWALTHPGRAVLKNNPTDYGLAFDEITFPSRTDQLALSGWLIPASGSKTIVIEAHGYAANRSLDKPALPVAQALYQKGISTLLFDFRDSGTSPGTMVSVGDFEQRDLLGAVDYAKKLGYQHIGVIGYSMGAATAAIVASGDPDVQALVLDSPFADLRTYLQAHMSVWTHLPGFPFTPLVLWETPALTGIDLNLVDPLRDIAGMGKRPVLFIAGDADTTIPMSNSQELWQKTANPEDTLWIVHGAKHVGAYGIEPKIYTQKVSDFFSQYLGGEIKAKP